jgi:hypothetical protein
MTARSMALRVAALAAFGVLLVVPALVDAQQAEGFDGYIQSGTCAAPTDDLRVKLTSDGDHDVEPYVAQRDGEDDTVVLGYYGSPSAPGFGFSAIYTDQDFSLVIAETENGDPVACGDILEPDADRFAEAGVAVVQLLPVGDSTVQGVAVIQRTQLERELDVTPTRVRLLLSTDSEVAVSAEAAAGFDGYVQGGTCDAPTERLRMQLKSRGDHDVRPYLASPDGPGEPVPLAYYGAPLVPGFGLAAAHTDQPFSLVLTTTDSAEPVACGDILRPDSDDFADAGLALVRLLPVGGSGVTGYALIERIPLQRELDVTPTRVRIVVFAPPAPSS